MVVAYLIVLCVISVVNLCVLTTCYRKQMLLYFLAVFGAIVVANVGYLLMATASTLEGVLAANKACYFGACFLPLFEFFIAVRLCHFRVPAWGSVALSLLSLVVFILSCTVGFSDIYYVSADYTKLYGVAAYTAVFGPAHMLWNFLLATYMVLNITVILYVARTKRNVSYKTLVALSLLCLVSIGSFVVSRFFGSDTLVMPAVYVLSEFILLYSCVLVRMYDVSRNVLDALISENDSAFVAFSVSGSYMGCNDIALKFFPELKELRIDQTLPSEGGIVKVFSSWIDAVNKGNVEDSIHFSFGEAFYKATLKSVKRWNISKIIMFKIEDETNTRRFIKRLGASNTKLENLVKSNVAHIHTIQEQMIVGMARMVERRDVNTGDHIKRTSKTVAIFVDELQKDSSLNFSKEFYEALVATAPMHDLGKIAIDDHILRKSGKFTDEEFEVMKTHAEKGAAIVENLLTEIETPFFVEIARNVACYHHERWDGSGYPFKLAGEKIPFEARVMAVADVYDALVSKRCYKDQESLDLAYDEILKDMGPKFDPSLKPYFINIRSKVESYYKSEIC